jgi:hypothetical protein
MAESATGFAGNPNICAACLQMVEELEDPAQPPAPAPVDAPPTDLKQPTALAKAA